MSRLSDIFEPLFSTIKTLTEKAVADVEQAISEAKQGKLDELKAQAEAVIGEALAAFEAEVKAVIDAVSSASSTASQMPTENTQAGTTPNSDAAVNQ